VSKEPLLVHDLGLRLEELVERSPFRRQLLHRREVAALGESRGVAVSRQIFRGDRKALIPDVNNLATNWQLNWN
jgi:hypothetical protein